MKFLATTVITLGLLTSATLAAGGWVQNPAESFSASGLKVQGVVGILSVDVKPVQKISVQVSGEKDRVGDLKVFVSGGSVRITAPPVNRNFSLFNWHSWLGDHHISEKDMENLKIHVVLPDQKFPVRVEKFIGRARIGNTHGALKFQTSGRGDAEIGNIADADISLAGYGKIHLGRVAGKLSAKIAGAGDVTAGDVDGGLAAKIAGTGNVAATSVHGPVEIRIAGQGKVAIAGGEADPFRVRIAGQGEVDFNGVAHNPHIRSAGMATVRVKKYTGNLEKIGNVNFAFGVQDTH